MHLTHSQRLPSRPTWASWNSRLSLRPVYAAPRPSPPQALAHPRQEALCETAPSQRKDQPISVCVHVSMMTGWVSEWVSEWVSTIVDGVIERKIINKTWHIFEEYYQHCNMADDNMWLPYGYALARTFEKGSSSLGTGGLAFSSEMVGPWSDSRRKEKRYYLCVTERR